MSSQGVMSSKQANNNPGLCPIKGQKSSPCSQVRARDRFSSLAHLLTDGDTIVSIKQNLIFLFHH